MIAGRRLLIGGLRGPPVAAMVTLAAVVLVWVGVLALPGGSVHAITWSGNLLTNPGAETGDLTGWTVLDPPEFGAVIANTNLGLGPPWPDVPHSGTYLFASDHTYGTGVEDKWQISQFVDLTPYMGYGPLVIQGGVWGSGNGGEQVRLLVREYSGSTYTKAYDSGFGKYYPAVGEWGYVSFGPISLDPGVDRVEFIIGGMKKAGEGVCNQSGLDDALLQVAVPEPVTLAGLALGIGSLATYLRRRRQA